MMIPTDSSEDAAMLKKRKLLEMIVYSYLLSFKDGATLHHLENNMESILGYNPDFKAGGCRNLKELLDEHANIQRQFDGTYKSIPVAETRDLTNLINKQKGKQKGGKSSKKRRPASSNSYRQFSGVRQASVQRGCISEAVCYTTPVQLLINSCAPLMFSYSKSPKLRHSTSLKPATAQPMKPLTPSSSATNNSFRQSKKEPSVRKMVRPESAASYMFPTSSTPLPRKGKIPSSKVTTTSTLVGTSSNDSVTVVAASARKECRFPSIKEFYENVKLLFIKQYPHSINIIDIGREYGLEYGQEIIPEALFSKTWPTFVKSMFADFLDIDSQQNVKLKDSYARHNPEEMGRVLNSASSSIPSIETPTSLMCSQMKGLVINKPLTPSTSHKTDAVLPFEDRPPGMESPSTEKIVVRKVLPSQTPDGRNSLKIQSTYRDREHVDDKSTTSSSQSETFEYSTSKMMDIRTYRMDPLISRKVSTVVNKTRNEIAYPPGQKPLLPSTSLRRPHTSADIPTARLASRAFKALATQEQKLPIPRRVVECSPLKKDVPKTSKDTSCADENISSFPPPSRCALRQTKLLLPPEARPSSAMYFVSPRKQNEEKRVTRQEPINGSLRSTVTPVSKTSEEEMRRSHRLALPPQASRDSSKRISPNLSSNYPQSMIEMAQKCPLDENDSFDSFSNA